MGGNNETETEQQLLMERIEVASEIVRSSQAAVAFQRAFYLEILAFARVVNEVSSLFLFVFLPVYIYTLYYTL